MRVAIIDDQINFLDIYSNILKEISFLEIYTFKTIKAFESDKSKFDLILMDINMPDCDGIKYAKSHKDLNIVFLTSQSHRIKEAFGINVYGFIEKSDGYDYFLKQIYSIIDQIKNEDYVSFKIYNQLCNFKKTDIVYAQYISYKTIGFVYDNKQFIIKGYTLKDFKNLVGDLMIYSDKGTLINTSKINELIGDVLYLEGISQTFTISRRRLKDFINL